MYVVSGSISVEEVMEIMGVNSLPDDEEEEYRTLASFILKQLNKVPQANDSFIALGWTFKVLSMDKFRILKVSMTGPKKS
jgi:putative hemolysin